MNVIRRLIFLVIAVFVTCALGYSNPQNETYTRLARLSYLEGRVSFQHGSDVDWSEASVNLPLEPGDRIYTGNDGKAEIEFDDGSTFRMAGNSDAEILSLREELIQIRMSLGLSTLNVLGDADFEIDTPTAAFNAVREGIYRFDIIENGDTDAIARKGELEVANNRFSQRLRAGDLIHLSLGDSDNPEVSSYSRRDQWDEWNDRRNADLRVYGNQRYLPDNVYMGASELDRYGRWVNVESYGTAWIPGDVGSVWSPYSVGRWCYRPMYGWTWVSYEPWGWLPYHYGRWYRSSLHGWCWLPGPSFGFNFWSPGLVTFYNGPGWVSWCPLGPGDYYDLGNYHYRKGIFSHQIAELRRQQTRRPGDPFNRDVQGAFRTAQLEQFRDGSFDGKARNTRWGNIARPWSQGTLVQNRLDIQPSARSYSAMTDRIAVRPSVTRPLPAVVRTTPEQGAGNRERFKQITNPQIRSGWSGSARSRGEQNPDGRPSGRVIQVPPNTPAPNSSTQGDRRENNPRSFGRMNDATGSRSPAAPVRRDAVTPSAGQDQKGTPSNPPKQHNERTVPERRQNPQPHQASPKSEFQQESTGIEAPRPIGRWSNSGTAESAAPSEGGRVFTVPSGRWNNANPGYARPAESGNAVNRSVPQPEPQVRTDSSRSEAWRAPESGRSPSFSAPAPAAARPSFERNEIRSAPAPSRQTGSPGRSAPENNAGRRR